MDKKIEKLPEEEKRAILKQLVDAMPDIPRMEQRAEMLRVMWMAKRRSLRHAEEKESKAKAEYFNAHEALVLAKASTMIGQVTTFPQCPRAFGTKKDTSNDNRRDDTTNIPPVPTENVLPLQETLAT